MMRCPNGIAERQVKPALTTRAALKYLYTAGFKSGRCPTADDVRVVKRTVAKRFWTGYFGVVKTLDEALVTLEARGNVVLPAAYKRVAVEWDTLSEVAGAIPAYFEWVLASGKFPTSDAAFRKYRKLWDSLGGDKDGLQKPIDHALLRLCGAGRLKHPPAAPKRVAVSAFSGSGLCHQAFTDAGYDHVLDADIVTDLEMGPYVDNVHYAAGYDISLTARKSGEAGATACFVRCVKWPLHAGAFVQHLCQQPPAKVSRTR